MFTYLGRYETELDLFAGGTMKSAFVNAGLVPSVDVSRADMLRILRTYVATDLAYHPITARRFSKFLLAAKDTLQDFVSDTVSSYTPLVTEIMLKDQASDEVRNLETSRRVSLIQGLLDDPVIAGVLPDTLAEATADLPLDWIPVILPADGLSDEAVHEQSQALRVCISAVDRFVHAGCRGVKFPCLVGRPGSGKSHILKLACAYALSKGLQVELMSLTSERARKLGGNHLHLVFPLGVKRGGSTLSNGIAYDCFQKLKRDEMKKLVIKRTDVFVFEEIGLVSAQMFCALDLVLQIVMENSLPWGGKLLMCSGDAKQLPPISGQPLWSSIQMCTVMSVVVFTADVRARDQELRWLNDQCRRQLTSQEAEAVADVVLSQCTFIDDWANVPQEAVRIVSTRAAEQIVMREFLSTKTTTAYMATDEVQNNTTWEAADTAVTNRLNNACYEYDKCELFVGAVIRMTYNERHGTVQFSQGQVGVVTALADSAQPLAQQALTVRLAPPGTRQIRVDSIPAEWPEIHVRRRTTPAILVGRALQMGRRTQFPVRYHLASTIHRIQGDTVALYATQLSDIHREYRLWQKEQFAVLISRAEHIKDIIFVGGKTDTKRAIVKILQQSSKWDMLIDRYISSLNTLGAPEVREISLDVHPFKPMYRELPSGISGLVYLLVSMAVPEISYLGETENLKASLLRHNTGYGDECTRQTSLHPWGVYAFVCGFDDNDVASGVERRKEFYESVRQFVAGAGPEKAYAVLRDKVHLWTEMGCKNLVLVKCGELRHSRV